jgi:hypothetical protein
MNSRIVVERLVHLITSLLELFRRDSTVHCDVI